MNCEDKETIAKPTATDRSIFDAWAKVYDTQPNPLLILEERHLPSLFPALRGGRVLDVGCGTGRWLCKLEALGTASLTGTDCSSAMLDCAREKVEATTKLCEADCLALPCADRSKTLVLASFVLGYIKDLAAFAQECERVVSPGGWLLLSDMHPVTTAMLNWKRSFESNGQNIEVEAQSRSLEEIVSTFSQYGFDLRASLEPSFGPPELPIFESAGKSKLYKELLGTPAIYILKLQRRMPFTRAAAISKVNVLQLRTPHIAASANDWREGVILVEGDRITSISKVAQALSPVVDLNEWLILPGLINAHDHFEFGLFPNLGRSAELRPYQSSTEWAQEIHEVHARTISLHRSVPEVARLWWVAIRNLLCGTTTVCHHNPLHDEFQVSGFPIKVISGFSWAHSLRFDPRLVEKFRMSTPNCPFILHASEGIDGDTREEFSKLDSMGLIDQRTVLVHGLSLTAEEVSLLNQRGASLITCPTSNNYLFRQTLSRERINSIERIAVGTDSPLTATGDLLDEIRYLHADTGIAAGSIYKMVTTNSAEILHLECGSGEIIESGPADLIAVRKQMGTPASVLCELTFDQVELVLVSGVVQVASLPIYELLPPSHRSNMELIEIAGHRRWLRAPLHELFHAAEKVLGADNVMLSGRKVRYG